MKHKIFLKEKSVVATVIVVIVIAAIFLMSYFTIDGIIKKRCLQRMEEGVNTVIGEVSAKLNRDSRILNSAADILSESEDFSVDALKETMRNITPLLETMRIKVLLPDNTIINDDGSVTDGTGSISFAEEAPRGEYVTNRLSSVADGNTLVLRHFVPIVRDNKPVALLYGVTILDDLPKAMNIDNIYNASADVYIIDTDSGDLIMDTRHETLSNISDMKQWIKRGGENWDGSAKDILEQKKGYMVYQSRIGDEWNYLYYAPAGINQWSIAVSVPRDVAFASLYSIQRVFLTAAFVMAIAVVLYYMWVHKNAREIMQHAVERAVLQEKLQKAEAAERAKTTFLANMSHDIRTPMNAIIGFTTLAESNLDNKERIRDYLGKILASGNHLLSLINDILDMSRIESGKLNIEEKPCSISDVFRDMRSIIQNQMKSKQLNFFMDTIDVMDENIYCDKLHLNQVLLNLLSNAIKFTPPGGYVSLTIRQKPGAPTGYGAYEIRVKDTGIGMSPEFAEHVFEPFERERSSTVSGIQGTGLGMAITKSIVDTMGGTIEVDTEPGHGSEFIINFTFRLQSESRQIEGIKKLQGLRALVVDDSFSTCDSVTKMLTQIGMRAEWTLYGKEAILRANQAIELGDEFYTYIIDWTLPDVNGIEVARQLRAAVGDTIPIIIITAYDWGAIEDEAREAGVTAFCSKPIFLSELRDVLSTVVGESEIVSEPKLSETEKKLDQIKGTRILLVEDNELNREIAEELLTENGFVVETANDGTVAVDMVRNSEHGYYSLILMDIQMPLMDGYTATRTIRELDDPVLSRIPIVAMTANAFEDDRRQAIESGMNAHLAKPFDIDKLLRVLTDLLTRDTQRDSSN